jgi:hypothetical protein
VVLIEYLDKAAHMGTLEFLGQVDIHVDTGDGLLTSVHPIKHGDGVADVFHAHLVNVYVAVISEILDVHERLIS